MSTFNPARPRYTLPFAGENYDLIGTLEVVEAVEYLFKDDIVQVTARVTKMGLTDTARLLSAILNACEYKMTTRQVADTIHNTLGIRSEAAEVLRVHMYAFLRITLEPPELREKMATKMGEMIGKLSPAASPGDSTKSSA